MFNKIIIGLILSIGYGSLHTIGTKIQLSDDWARISSKSLTLNDCGASYPVALVTGGTPAKHGMYPWMVSMQWLNGRRWVHLCGAVILNKRWILTAAHCFRKMYHHYLYRFVAGINELSQSNLPDTNIYKVSKIIPHPMYNSTVKTDDIALVQTNGPIKIEDGFIGGICLPDWLNDPNSGGDTYTVIGWGDLDWAATRRGYKSLMEVKIPLVDLGVCKSYYETPLRQTHICAGSLNKTACQGDSGGPLFKAVNDVYVLIGIVSFGRMCGSNPVVYTKVSSYLSWMEDVIL